MINGKLDEGSSWVFRQNGSEDYFLALKMTTLTKPKHMRYYGFATVQMTQPPQTLPKKLLKQIRRSEHWINGNRVMWPPYEYPRSPLTLDAHGNRYRKCSECEVWFSRKSNSTCPRKLAVYCGKECQVKNWPTHRISCPFRSRGSSYGGH